MPGNAAAVKKQEEKLVDAAVERFGRLDIMVNKRRNPNSHLGPRHEQGADFLKKVRELYEGTRLGRQELQGAMILDLQNALFKDDWLIHDQVAEDLIEQVTVGVDPSGGNDEV